MRRLRRRLLNRGREPRFSRRRRKRRTNHSTSELTGRVLRRSQDFERFEALATTISGIAEPVDLGDKNSVTGAIETIKTRSTVKELVKDLRESLPNIYSALVDERDEYMTQSLLSRLSEQPRSAPQRVVAVVGLAHEDGINRRLAKAGYAAAPAPPRRLCQAA